MSLICSILQMILPFSDRQAPDHRLCGQMQWLRQDVEPLKRQRECQKRVVILHRTAAWSPELDSIFC